MADASIIIHNYNRCQFLPDAIDSCISQIKKNFKIQIFVAEDTLCKEICLAGKEEGGIVASAFGRLAIDNDKSVVVGSESVCSARI
ncbi:MAG: hypothetical protein D4S01_04435 [Dehalococcoidia bacterium]|nr:MAG: hypothetical protein D4S01_04435 [Dehalococcoidia bacterium]